jgi:DNA-binding transcriptional LysR family regulator
MLALDIRQLRQVLEIARAGSFARAATTLGISQPTLSRSIARVEDILGVALFDRSGEGATPTVFGSYVARRAEDALGGVASIAQEVAQLAAGEGGQFRIGAGPATMLGVVPHLVDGILDRYPRLELTIVRELGPRLRTMLVRRELDMMIANVPAMAGPPLVVEERLSELTAIYVVRSGHPILQHPGPFSFADLLAYRLAAAGLPARTDDDILAEVPYERRANYRAYVSSEYPILKRICLRTDAVAAGPRFAFAGELEAGALVALNVNFESPVACSILTNPEGEQNPVLREIRDMARRVWNAQIAADTRAAREAQERRASRTVQALQENARS